ncbi:hypothetical protein GXP71_14525 [Cellulomonas sp. H30R-01]|uniref:hypothetical protein n=1 Tax=Cellulomonas sp. H30R-01 TaxID=2704467 RepID=UPI00138BEE9D|nr:hypothetical protein [Cellulomonas sp. H30R-01]QHT57172.1 hypothetical protein GXP71_14525 [Cellulomonas sp. H30R-01]
MTEPDVPETRPAPSGVIAGGAPDPVRDTAPHAAPAPDDVEAQDSSYIDDSTPRVVPVVGAGPAVPPPPARPIQE